MIISEVRHNASGILITNAILRIDASRTYSMTFIFGNVSKTCQFSSGTWWCKIECDFLKIHIISLDLNADILIMITLKIWHSCMHIIRNVILPCFISSPYWILRNLSNANMNYIFNMFMILRSYKACMQLFLKSLWWYI